MTQAEATALAATINRYVKYDEPCMRAEAIRYEARPNHVYTMSPDVWAVVVCDDQGMLLFTILNIA